MKSTFAIFTLVIFLCPFIEREIHNLSNNTRILCTSAFSHYHAPDHICGLCDFTNGFTGSPSFDNHRLILIELTTGLVSISENTFLLQEKDFHSLRAPPPLLV